MKNLWKKFLLWGPSKKTAVTIIAVSSVVTIVSLILSGMYVRGMINSAPSYSQDTEQGSQDSDAEPEASSTLLSAFISDVQTDSAKLYVETNLGENGSATYNCTEKSSNETLQTGQVEYPFTQLSKLPNRVPITCQVATDMQKTVVTFRTLDTFNAETDTLSELSVAVAGRPNHVLRATWNAESPVEPTVVRYAIRQNDQLIAMGQSQFSQGELTRVIPKDVLSDDTYELFFWRALVTHSNDGVQLQAYTLSQTKTTWNVFPIEDAIPDASFPTAFYDGGNTVPAVFSIDEDKTLTVDKMTSGIFFSQGSTTLEEWSWFWLTTGEPLSLAADAWDDFTHIGSATIKNEQLYLGGLSPASSSEKVWRIVSPQYEWLSTGALAIDWKMSGESRVNYQWDDIPPGSFIIGITDLLTGATKTRVANLENGLAVEGLSSTSLYSVSISYFNMNPGANVFVDPVSILVSAPEYEPASVSINYSVVAGPNDFTITWENPGNIPALSYVLEVKTTDSSVTPQLYFIDDVQPGGNSYTVEGLSADTATVRLLPLLNGQVLTEEPFSEISLTETPNRVLPLTKINVSRVGIREIEVSWNKSSSSLSQDISYDVQNIRNGKWVEIPVGEARNSVNVVVDEDQQVFDIRVRARSQDMLTEFAVAKCFISDSFFCENTQ